MRLTNVAQMDLVAGRLFSYAVEAGSDVGTMLPISYDQGRHVALGQRPGSWMALAFRLTAPFTREELGAAWDAVVARHGTLRTAFRPTEAGGLQLHEVELAPGPWTEHAVAEGRRTREVLRELLDATCAPFDRPSHRLCMVEPGPEAEDPRPEFVIASDHAHVDMWSLVVLLRDLVVLLGDRREGRDPAGVDLPEAPPFAEHTAELTGFPPTPDAVVERWAAILEAGGGGLPRFPLPLGELSPPPPETVEVRDVLDAEATEHLAAVARSRGVRLLTLGISVLTEVTAQMTGRPLRAVFPVHSRHRPQWRDAVGWFITNAVIESADPDLTACAAAVKEATGLGSWPLAPILAPYGELPSPPGLFAVSWLDVRRLPLPAGEATDLRYVSAAMHTDGVMIWFLVNESGLHLRCRYPGTPEARENVGRWLDGVQQGLVALTVPDLAT